MRLLMASILMAQVPVTALTEARSVSLPSSLMTLLTRRTSLATVSLVATASLEPALLRLVNLIGGRDHDHRGEHFLQAGLDLLTGVVFAPCRLDIADQHGGDGVDGVPRQLLDVPEGLLQVFQGFQREDAGIARD